MDPGKSPLYSSQSSLPQPLRPPSPPPPLADGPAPRASVPTSPAAHRVPSLASGAKDDSHPPGPQAPAATLAQRHPSLPAPVEPGMRRLLQEVARAKRGDIVAALEARLRQLGGPDMPETHSDSLAVELAVNPPAGLGNSMGLIALLKVLGEPPAPPSELRAGNESKDARTGRETKHADPAAAASSVQRHAKAVVQAVLGLRMGPMALLGIGSRYQDLPVAMIGALADAMLDRLLDLRGPNLGGMPRQHLVTAFSLLVEQAPPSLGLLERILAHTADAAARGVAPMQVFEVISALRLATNDDRSLARTVLRHALDNRAGLCVSALHAWLCGTATLANRGAGPRTTQARLATLGPTVLSAQPPLTLAQAAAAAMALFTPLTALSSQEPPASQMQEVLTTLATVLAARSEPLPAETLAGLAMGITRSLILAGGEPPSTLVETLRSVTGLSPATLAALALGIEWGKTPARCLADKANGLRLSSNERFDWLEAACLSRANLLQALPDIQLEAIRSLGLAPVHDAVRHTLIDHVTAARPLPQSEQGLADLHRRKLAALVPRPPEPTTPPGDAKREVRSEERALSVPQAGEAEGGPIQDLMAFYAAFRARFPVDAPMRNVIVGAWRADDLRALAGAQTIVEGFLADLDGRPGAAVPGHAKSLRAHVQGMKDAIATDLQALRKADDAARRPAPRESKTKTGTT